MLNAQDVMVQRAIVHLINHPKQTLTRSEVELPLQANPKLQTYFSDQVVNALSDGQTSSARFNSAGDQSAITEIHGILDDPNKLIPSSQLLAELLMKAMGRDARIKPENTSIATCIYTASNYPSTNFLSLIKIDPSEALVEKVVTEKGKRLVTFDVISDVMPTKDVKLRKAALVSPKGKFPDLDLVLLDRQVAAVAANFFRLTFLNTLAVLHPVTSADDFIAVAEKTRRALMETPKDKPEHIGPQESDLFMRHVEKAVLRGGFHRTRFATKAPLPAAGKKVLSKRLEKQFPNDTEIAFDKKHAKELFLKTTRYRGDQGVLLEIDSKYASEVIQEMNEDPPLADGTIITRINLKVRNLHRVT